MFMNDVYKKDEIKEFAIQDLRRIGVKYRRKKLKQNIQDIKKTVNCFKVDLSSLPTQIVTLIDGQQLIIPIVIHELCSFILNKVDTEGIFRKEGSKSRQNEIKLSLNAGCKLEDDYHVIDVAGILKMFLRELPEPLIPNSFHDYFLRCSILEKGKLDAVLLLCLLLPQEHLNTLAYLLRFFNTVTKRSVQNKMTSLNLSIVIGPNIIPFQQDKASHITQHKIKKICELTQLLIDNANKVGIIPDYIIDQVANSTTEELNVMDKKKKRRSGSLTRMFNGLKKIVGNKTEDMSPTVVTPDLLLTPSITRSVKKRKIDTLSLSSKKKKDIMSKLPEGKVLKTPFSSISTPISENPKGKEKKSQWYTKSKTSKPSKIESEENIKSSRTSLGPKSLIERRWSAVSSNVAAFRKNRKRTSFGGSHHDLNTDSLKNSISKEDIKIVKNSDDGFNKISQEYEEIKNRVSAIEKRISMQIEAVTEEKLDSVKNVQTAYEQTLVQSEPLSPTTDHLARRLSRELKIRRSSDHVIIRSPSARKIGTIKRRSRELERQSDRLRRNKSWHITSEININIPRVNLNQVRSGQNNLGITENMISKKETSTPNLSDRCLRSSLTKYNSTSSLDRSEKSSFHSVISNNFTDDNSVHWTSGDKFFSTVKTPGSEGNATNGRASVAKIRSQNAGMVLAKAKLFDNLIDSTDHSNLENKSNNINIKTKTNSKIGSVRQPEVKLLPRVRNLKGDERKLLRKTSSPRRNRLNLSQRQKLQAAKQLVDSKRNKNLSLSPLDIEQNLISPIKYAPSKSPIIKKPLLTKSPKRLCRTPLTDRSTPLKVFTPRTMDY